MRIIVIDDEEIILTVAKTILQTVGYETLSAVSGEIGLELLKENQGRIDLVVLNWVLPSLTGLETFARIRVLAPKLPVPFSSGYPIDINMVGVVDTSNIGFLYKPYRASSLIAKIESMVLA